ncbi:MAG: hypothetical protein K2X97_17835 [Mycobacteriaceae bacterium]|nr:hypothetical protein [Mycobacteriaceae bacterium]
MTAAIGAPAVGAPDAWAGFEADAGGGVPVEVVWGCPDIPPPVCEHPATSNGTATSAAIRIPSG